MTAPKETAMLAARSTWRRLADDDDRGSALVAAIGVAVIGMLLATLVIAQSVIANDDSGRDRARTMQVHGAEGAVDQVYALLEAGTPCRWPATGTTAVSTIPDETRVAATIVYKDAAGTTLTCSATGLSGIPASAFVTATAESTGLPGTGLSPSRTVQAKLLLTPLTEPGAGAAIYSYQASSSITNDFTLMNGEPDTPADLWINTGNVDCNSNVTIYGRVFVASGNMSMSNACRVTSDVRVKTGLTMNQGTINGSAYVYAGNATLNGTQAHIDGSLLTSGTAVNSTNSGGGVAAVRPLVGGSVTTGWTPPGPVALVPLPEVLKKFSDWSGFSTATSMASWLNSEATANGAATWVPFRTGDACSTQISNASWSMGGNVRTPVGKTIIDATGCSLGFRAQNVNFTVRGDLVIFAQSFNFTNVVNFISDGGDYKVWIIVPDTVPNGSATCGLSGAAASKSIEVNSTVDFGGPKIQTFLYSPCDITISNNVKLAGQIYGREVKLQNNLKVTFRAVGVPGVALFPATAVAGAGYVVEVVYKREIGKPTP